MIGKYIELSRSVGENTNNLEVILEEEADKSIHKLTETRQYIDDNFIANGYWKKV